MLISSNNVITQPEDLFFFDLQIAQVFLMSIALHYIIITWEVCEHIYLFIYLLGQLINCST